MTNQRATRNAVEDEIDLGKFFRELWHHWYYFLISGIFCFTLGILYVLYKLPVYEATSSVLVGDQSSSSKDFEDFISSSIFGTSTSVPTEIGVLSSRSVVETTALKLGMGVEYWNTTSWPSTPIYKKQPFNIKTTNYPFQLYEMKWDIEIVDSTRYKLSGEYSGTKFPNFDWEDKPFNFGQPVKGNGFEFVINRVDTIPAPDPGSTYQMIVRSPSKMMADIMKNLKVEAFDKDAYIVNLTYDDVVPRRSLDFLNTMCKEYIDLDVQDKATVAALTLQFVEQQLDTTGSSLSNTEKKMEEFKVQHSTVDLGEEAKGILQKVNDLDVERVKNQIEYAALDNLFDYVVKNKDITSLAPTSVGIPDPLLVSLIQDYQTLQNKRKSLAYGVKENAPAVKVLDQQLAETRSTLIENISNIRNRMQVTSKKLVDQIGAYDQEIHKIPEMERQLLSIQRNFSVDQNIYTYLLQKKAESSILKATAVSDNKVLDVAELADDPVAPSKIIVLIVCMFFSGFIPFGLVLTKNILRVKVRNREDITDKTQIPVTGVVGHAKDGNNLAVLRKPKAAVSESFRTLRTNLSYYGLNDGNRTILITSSIGGEGKSFVTINLATVLSMQQKKVIVLGLDLRKPKLFQDFELKNDAGMSNLLVGTATLDDVIKKTNIPNLDLIPAGPVPPNPAELLSRPSLKNTIDELRKRYDYIVIDSPPVGIVSDGFLLVPYSDICLYIVRQGYSRQEFITTLDEMNQNKRFNNLSIVLNDSDFSRNYGYGHNYGYVKGGYGYYDEDDRPGFFKRIFRRKG